MAADTLSLARMSQMVASVSVEAKSGAKWDTKVDGVAVEGKESAPKTMEYPKSFVLGQNGAVAEKGIDIIGRNSDAKVPFTINQKAMVNFWVDSSEMGLAPKNFLGYYDISLTLDRTDASMPSLISAKQNNDSAESISTVLEAGSYVLHIQDHTEYSKLALGIGALAVPLHAQVTPYTSQHIVGRISIEGRGVTMPVSMSVAEFEDGQRKVDYSRVSALKSDLPVWVVVHGMDSGEKTDVLVELEKSMQKYSGIQIATVDWERASKDGLPTQDAQWTPSVGQWVADQLTSAKVDSSNMNFAGWSHGSYVSYFASETINKLSSGKKSVNSIVALDPAGNWPMLSGLKHTPIDFRKYAENSIAFEGSWMAGSNSLAGKSSLYFRVNPLDTGSLEIGKEHSIPPTVFAGMLEYNRIVGGEQRKFLSLDTIMNSENRSKDFTENYYSGGADFVIDAGVETRMVIENDGLRFYPYASPLKMHYADGMGVEKTIDLDGSH